VIKLFFEQTYPQAEGCVYEKHGVVQRSKIGDRNMDTKNLVPLSTVGFLALLFVSGCAGDFAKLRVESGSAMSVETLMKESDNYVTYADGLFPNVPAAVIFDPKGDDRAIAVGPRWQKVQEKKSVTRAVGLIKAEPGRGVNIPRLWRILGPDDYLYGYVYTWLTRLDMKMIDEKTLLIENLT
jgi:hypothetical protein